MTMTISYTPADDDEAETPRGGGRRAARREGTGARLTCGTVLTYEWASLVPQTGEVVPCRRHGYCAVASRTSVPSDERRASAHTAQARPSQAELVEFLEERPVTSVHLLRRNRFSLRAVAAAQKDGLVDVDLIAGQVALTEQHHKSRSS